MNEPLPVPRSSSRDVMARPNYRVIGADRWGALDLYHRLLRAPLGVLLASAFAVYLAATGFFAVLFWLDLGGVDGARPGHFGDAFFFSVHTLSTIGYGAMSPSSWFSHMVVVVESFVGLVGVALGTGLVFSRFSRPSARVTFSDKMVVHERDGVPTLQFRMINDRVGHLPREGESASRTGRIYDVRVSVSALVDTVTAEGHALRRIVPLRVEKPLLPMFAVTHTVMHPIEAGSALHGVCTEDVFDRVRLIVVTVTGIEDTFSQTVHSTTLYDPQDIVFQMAFRDILHREGGVLIIRRDWLHDVVPVDSPQAADDAHDADG